jgi:hypothetical protein
MKKIKRQRNSSKPCLLFPENRSQSAYRLAKPLMDYDYIYKLNKDEKAFLKEFNRSYYLNQKTKLSSKPNSADHERRKAEVTLVFGHKFNK